MSASNDRQLAVLLACFAQPESAEKAREPLDRKLRTGNDAVLDTVLLTVDARHRASVHDPRRVAMGTLSAGLTWGLFGLVASGWKGLLIWALLGAVCGGLYAYYALHHATKAELAQIGAQLPANSSALLTFVETSDPERVLSTTADYAPSAASVAAIANDLSARVFAGAQHPLEVSDSWDTSTRALERSELLSMIMVRFPGPDEARQTASKFAATDAAKTNGTQLELVVSADRDGRRHVSDPTLGVAAFVKRDIVSWGAFGVLVGAVSGAIGGGILKQGVLTGVAWAAFGVFAGLLYGSWAGRAISARRLKSIGPLLAPGTSMLLAWGNGDDERAIDTLSAPHSQRLVLRFSAVERGALIETG